MIKDPTTYDFDEKQRQVILTEEGSEKIEETLLAGGHLALIRPASTTPSTSPRCTT